MSRPPAAVNVGLGAGYVSPRKPMRVVIAGGGVAGLETLLALRAVAGHLVKVTILSPAREFAYRPVTVAEAFDRAHARVYDLVEIVADQGAEFLHDGLARVVPGRRIAVGHSGREVPFDALVVATGALQREWLPGALTFRGRVDVPALRELLGDLVSGRGRSVALALPSERVWALPLYELALMIAGHLRERGVDDAVTLVTPEDEPLEWFGPAAAAALQPLLTARAVTLRTSSRAAARRGRALVLGGGGEIFVDRVITLPMLEGPRLPGLPHDHDGFIPVDAYGRVAGVDDVYAAGDVTAFPLKQGGLAAQQVDAVASALAARAGAIDEPAPFEPVLRGLLLTEGAPLYLRAEPRELRRQSTVAIEAPGTRRRARRAASAATGQALWWPPAKIAGRYLAPYLATARPAPLSAGLLADRVVVPGPPVSESEYEDALELALLLADSDARWGDYASALNALDAAESLRGALPPEYEAKRREWRAEGRLALGR